MCLFHRLTLRATTLGAGIFLGLVPPLSAARALPPSLQAVLDCQRETNDQIRLACYDRAAASLGQHALAMPRWNYSSDSSPDFDPAKPFHQPRSKDETPENITVPLLRLGNSDGKTVFYLGNNQEWRAQNDEFVYIDHSRRNTATLKKSLLGLGYLLMINGSDREISVRRVN